MNKTHNESKNVDNQDQDNDKHSSKILKNQTQGHPKSDPGTLQAGT